MSDDLHVENISLRAAPLLQAAGGNPRVLASAVREAARNSPDLGPEEIVAVLQLELPEAFAKAEEPGPPSVDPDVLTDAEKSAYIARHGLDAYVAALKRQSEKRRAQYERARRGF